MNLEVLKTINETNVFDLKLGLRTMTDKEWQNVFNVLKINTLRIHNRKTRYLRRKCSGYLLYLSDGDNIDTTQDGYYCNYINDVLRNIRNGERDYCYHIYQVAELLRFEPKLNTVLVHKNDMDYIEVWLER